MPATVADQEEGRNGGARGPIRSGPGDSLPDFVNRLASFGKSEIAEVFGGIHPLTPPRPLLESPTRFCGDLPRN